MASGIISALGFSVLMLWKLQDPDSERLLRPDALSLSNLLWLGTASLLGGALVGIVRGRTTPGIQRIALGAAAGIGMAAVLSLSFFNPEFILHPELILGFSLSGGVVGGIAGAKSKARLRFAGTAPYMNREETRSESLLE